MKFKYKRYGPQTLRPVVPINIFANDQQMIYEVLVDSGADISIFHSRIADILGIDLETGKISNLSGVTGKEESIYMHSLTVVVGGHFLKLDVGFLENIGGEGYGIVGQKGFFDKFIVKFDLAKGEIDLKLRK